MYNRLVISSGRLRSVWQEDTVGNYMWEWAAVFHQARAPSRSHGVQATADRPLSISAFIASRLREDSLLI